MSSVTNDSRHKRITQASSDGVDRISNLPEPIISQILSLLPTEDAVATSLLSTKWKLLWRNIHNLSFDDGARHFSQLQHTDKEQDSLFGYFVNKVLLFLDRKCIDKFSLKINQFGDVHYVTIWIATAVSRSAKLIEFDGRDCYYDFESLYFDMPGSLFTCETLEVLNLIGRINLHVPNLVSLPNLKTLRLELVIYEGDESVCKLISGCSSLENLYVVRYAYDNVITFTISSPTLRIITLNFDNDADYLLSSDGNFPEEFNYKLAINAPQLRYLELTDTYVLKDFLFENLCLLDKARIDLDICSSMIEDDHYCKAIVKLLQQLYNVKNLSLMGNVMEALNGATLSTSFLRLSQLTISGICWTHPLLSFLEGSKKLESLSLLQYDYNKLQNMVEEPEKVPTCFLSCLKTILIEGFQGSVDELNMLAYILKNAKRLKTITIQANRNLGTEARSQLIQNVSNFPRGSPKCKFTFL